MQLKEYKEMHLKGQTFSLAYIKRPVILSVYKMFLHLNNSDTLNRFSRSLACGVNFWFPGRALHSEAGYYGVHYYCINYEICCKVMLWETIQENNLLRWLATVSNYFMGHSVPPLYQLMLHGIKSTY